MTFQQLRYLLEVYRTKSVAKAAENHFVSRPSISFSINSVETELGYPIFQRTKEGLVPTRQGSIFLDYARQICDTHKLMTSIDLVKQVQINFAVIKYAPVHKAAVRLLEEYPNRLETSFSFNIFSIEEIINRLSRFELDLALYARLGPVNLSIETQLEKRGFQWRVLHQIPTVLMIGEGHPLYDKPDLSPRDVENDTFFDTTSKEVSNFAHIKSMMRIPPTCVTPCNDGRLKFSAIQKGLGYTIGRLPSHEDIKRFGLRCIPIEGLTQRLTCVTNPSQPLPTEAQRFIALLEEELEHHVDIF